MDANANANSSSLRSICDLPDNILHLIVSHLPTKDAIRTSVLSKAWLHLWKEQLVSKIELEETTRDPHKRQKFIDFMANLPLVFHCTNLKRFSLSFQVHKDTSLVTKLLRHFISPEIQELSLRLESLSNNLVFPGNMFKCPLLREFHLSMQGIFTLPYYPNFNFQSLVTLNLEYVTFYKSTDQLFSGCPSLEELALIDCDWRFDKEAMISSASLQKITIWESKKDVENVFVERNRCQVRIFGSDNLREFCYEGVHNNDFFLHSSTSMVKACIKIHPDFISEVSERDAAAYFVLNLLREIVTAETLTISYNSIMAISYATSLTLHLPSFPNLAELNLVSMSPENLCCDALLILLQNSPRLQVLNFQGGVFMSQDHAHREMHLLLCVCFREHLKSIKINRFLGFETELFAIQILLRSALVLEKLYVCSDPCAPYVRLEYLLKDLRNKIESFPRASTHCEIEFENFELQHVKAIEEHE